MGVAETVQQVRGLFVRKRWPEAERLARQILLTEPENVDGNHVLAACLLATRKFEEARGPAARAVEGAPHRADVLTTLGRVHEQAAEHAVALDLFAKAAGLDPTDPLPHFRSGLVFTAQGRLDAAAAAYKKALVCDPDHPESLTNLADVYRRSSRLAEAIPLWERALKKNPNLPEANFALGNALAPSDPQRALALYDRAIAARPGFTKAIERRDALAARPRRSASPAASVSPAIPSLAAAVPDKRRIDGLIRRAVELKQSGRTQDSIAIYQEILAIDPRHVSALNNLGNAQRAIGRLADAISSLERAVAIDPNWQPAWYNLGTAHRAARHINEALDAYERAMALDPTHLDSRGAFVTMRLKNCDWRPIDGLPPHEHLPALFEAASPSYLMPPFDALTFGAPMPDALRVARNWIRRARHGTPLPPTRPRAEGPLRVGYLTSYFRTHAMTCLVGSLFGHHDRRRVMVHAYSYGRDDGSDIRRRVQSQFDVFRDISGDSQEAAAEKIRADGIDVLVDLNGHADDPRLGIALRRPAPVQMQWIGFPGSMGDDDGGGHVWDYTLVDRVVVPDDDRQHFSEHVIRLPDCYLVADGDRPIAPAPTRASQGLPDEGFVFACFNNNYKITPTFLSAWARILAQVPGSVLWLLGPRDDVVENLRREAAARGLDPARLVFAPYVSSHAHLGRHRLVDLSLDTQPYNAHTTALDALWAGAPILTLRGGTFVSRVCESVLRAGRLDELVADDLADYEARAVQIATDRAYHAALRAKVQASHAAPVFDTARTARALETAFELAVQQTLRGKKAHIDVPSED